MSLSKWKLKINFTKFQVIKVTQCWDGFLSVEDNHWFFEIPPFHYVVFKKLASRKTDQYWRTNRYDNTSMLKQIKLMWRKAFQIKTDGSVGPQPSSLLSQSKPHCLLLIVFKDVQSSRQKKNGLKINKLETIVQALANLRYKLWHLTFLILNFESQEIPLYWHILE